MKRFLRFIKKTFIASRVKCPINFVVICDGKDCSTCKLNSQNH